MERPTPKSEPATQGVPVSLSRRNFLGGTASLGLGLLLGFRWDPKKAVAAAGDEFVPNAFVRIAPDDTVTVIAKHLEMGQGTFTGLATILAEELDAAWDQVRVEAAPADMKKYANLGWGIQGTGGSSAMANSWTQLRTAGATARAMLVEAAAGKWKVPAHELRVAAGVVRHPRTGKHASFGELAAAAAKKQPPEGVSLKAAGKFQLIGRKLPRVDSADKARGRATFGLDVQRPGMLTALMARSPRFGGKVKSFDAHAAEKVPGVKKVVGTPRGVAVLAEGFWAAKKGRDALRVEWDDAEAEHRSTEQIMAEYRRLADTAGTEVHAEGDSEAALGRAKVVLEADYEFPYLAHAPMEPLNAVIQVKDGRADLWMGSQIPTLDQQVPAKILGLSADKVAIHTQYAGGSFGRRATPDSDIAAEAALVAKAAGLDVPIKLVWTREDDLTGGKYRPASLHRVRIGLDGAGGISGWSHRVVSQSILMGTPFAAMVKNGVDESSIEGAAETPYGFSDRRVELHTPVLPVSVLWWRSVGHTSNAFVMETLLDEIAAGLHVDPVEYRLRLLEPGGRHAAVLRRAAKEAGWGRQLPTGRAHGVAVHKSFGSVVAQVAEVSVGDEGLPRVHRVTVAVDCGRALNPHNVEAQMQGGIGLALGTNLFNEIVLEDGLPTVKNFDLYRPLRIHEMPAVDVHIVDSTADPTGVGEPGVPPLAPAVANAWFQLTGQRVRRLPFARKEA